jgi:superoxide reductase
MKIYRCPVCGNITVMLEDSGVVPHCCGKAMIHLVANTTDAALEKHVPAVEVNGECVKVKIGSVTHPMTEEHHISFVILKTNRGFKVNYLEPTQEPETCFHLCKHETPIEVYEYCNLHGLWKVVL